MTREQEAKMIFDLLKKNFDAGIRMTRVEMKHALGLTEMQFNYGFGLLKEQMAARGYGLVIAGWPYRYALPDVAAEQVEYNVFRLSGILTSVTRLDGQTQGAVKQFGNKGALRIVAKHVTRLKEDLHDALT